MNSEKKMNIHQDDFEFMGKDLRLNYLFNVLTQKS